MLRSTFVIYLTLFQCILSDIHEATPHNKNFRVALIFNFFSCRSRGSKLDYRACPGPQDSNVLAGAGDYRGTLLSPSGKGAN